VHAKVANRAADLVNPLSFIFIVFSFFLCKGMAFTLPVQYSNLMIILCDNGKIVGMMLYCEY